MEISLADRTALLALIGRFSERRIIVLGDLVADEYLHGEITRVSREAPVLILRQREQYVVPGGGANAANNLADLGAAVAVAGVLGDDESGVRLFDFFRHKGVSVSGVVRRRRYVTPTKTRVLGGVGHGHLQQIVRVDREPEGEMDAGVQCRLVRHTASLLSRSSAVLMSDYGYGACTPAMAGSINRLRGRIPAVVDSRYRILSYRRVTAATPNEPEMQTAFGGRVGTDAAQLHRAARRMLRDCALSALLVTRGRAGMALYQRDSRPEVLPIFGSDQVADVTGAGDTVIAVFTLSLAAGANFHHAAMLANCAGGIVVMKRGTATVTARELSEAIRNA